MHSWHDVKPNRIKADDFLAVIEISKGSKNKYELDKETGHLILDRVLFIFINTDAVIGSNKRSLGSFHINV